MSAHVLSANGKILENELDPGKNLDCHQNLIPPWATPHPSIKFHQNPFIIFVGILCTHRQTYAHMHARPAHIIKRLITDNKVIYFSILSSRDKTSAAVSIQYAYTLQVISDLISTVHFSLILYIRAIKLIR